MKNQIHIIYECHQGKPKDPKHRLYVGDFKVSEGDDQLILINSTVKNLSQLDSTYKSVKSIFIN